MKTKKITILIFTALILCIKQGVSQTPTLNLSDGNMVVNSATNLVILGDFKNSAIGDDAISLSGEIAISGDFTNNAASGDLLSGSTGKVIFNGNVDQEIAGTSTTTTFYDLDINKSAGDLLAATNFNVANQLIMTSGELDLQNATIDLGTSGSIENETETKRIKVGNITTNTGTIQATRTINNVTDFNPGNLGVLITTDSDLGEITVVRGHQVQQGSGSFTGNYGVARYYEIPNIGQLNENTQVKWHYWDAELNGHTEASLEIYQWVQEGGAHGWWTPLLGSVNTGTNLVSLDASPYSDYFDPPNSDPFTFTELFTLGSKDIPLPIELLSFNAKANENKTVNLEWSTATEINNDFFTIEKSIDGEKWDYVGEKKGAGNSNAQINYSMIDTEPYNGISYYRLKQTDFDGTYAYSDIRSVQFQSIGELSVYPNPASTYFVVEGLEQRANLSLYKANGQIVKTVNINPNEKINVTELAPGQYTLKIIGTQQNIKIIIQ